eukprot:s257_g54.t1
MWKLRPLRPLRLSAAAAMCRWMARPAERRSFSAWPARSAALRCREARKESPLVADPFACLLSDAFGGEMSEDVEDGTFMCLTAFVDRMLMDAVSRRLRQVLLWRSGTDTRAFRLHLPPQVRLIEVDDAEVHQAKSVVLDVANARPRCSLQRVVPEQLPEVMDPKKASFIVLEDLSQEDGPSVEHLSKELVAEGSRVVVVLRDEPDSLEATATHWLQLLQSCGWARSERVPDVALQQMCQDPWPTAPRMTLLVAERGPLELPQRPEAPGATRKDGAPMSSYGWRGD